MENRKIELTIPFTVTREDFENLMVTALEGGIDYWGYVHYSGEYNPSKYGAFAEWLAGLLWDGKIPNLEVMDVECDRTLGYFSIDRLFSNVNHPDFRMSWMQLLNETYDAHDADILFQSGVFNEVVYG
jgi:hypothetical protein